jgi:predicted nucleotidyltransferase
MRPVAQSFLRQPLSAVFANPANVRLLRELSRHGGEFSAKILAERSRLTKSSVTLALDYLSGLGLVEILGSAHSRLYRIDGDHPLASSLAALFAAEDLRFQNIIEAVRAAAIKAGATAVWLYGSVARGEDRPDSDVDVVVIAANDAGALKVKMRNLLREREDALRFSASVIGLDLEDVGRLVVENDPWWATMIEDGIPLLGPAPGALPLTRAGVGQEAT